MHYTLQINGLAQTVEADPEMPLLWVLRDLLDLKGTKFGCGKSFCGACTVHLNGTATRSCVTPISAVGSAAITTVEGIGT
ncbi:MAG TPA: 2Fe-2S iron-sulfur cluster-binding protein, partial [Steroidobacteraceae bacterium]|nr:2Fe-2S iron-sulfur cluster-binding protein [Steroidobacteraceae bacterium]